MRKIKLGENIFPDLSPEVMKDIKKFSDKYKISITFLFDDGVELESLDNKVDIRTCPGDCCFIDVTTGRMLIEFVENFNELQFFNENSELLLKIPILE